MVNGSLVWAVLSKTGKLLLAGAIVSIVAASLRYILTIFKVLQKCGDEIGLVNVIMIFVTLSLILGQFVALIFSGAPLFLSASDKSDA